jgi:hypothetical protein
MKRGAVTPTAQWLRAPGKILKATAAGHGATQEMHSKHPRPTFTAIAPRPRQDVSKTRIFQTADPDAGRLATGTHPFAQAGERVLDLCAGRSNRRTWRYSWKTKASAGRRKSAWKLEEARVNAQRRGWGLNTLAEDALGLGPGRRPFDRVLLDAPYGFGRSQSGHQMAQAPRDPTAPDAVAHKAAARFARGVLVMPPAPCSEENGGLKFADTRLHFGSSPTTAETLRSSLRPPSRLASATALTVFAAQWRRSDARAALFLLSGLNQRIGWEA